MTAQNHLDPDTLNKVWLIHFRMLKKFLNKFYQCLFPFKMPQKTRKLVLAGPRDSGKTSWCSVFHQIIPSECIASVTNEGQFSAAMITEATQLVIIDEWSSNRMRSDLAKTVLQGGWMVKSRKHQLPICVNNNRPFYITNKVPDFGDKDENVNSQIEVFQTTPLPNSISDIDRWIHEHVMDCIVWAANQITKHHDVISKEELWYENCDNSEVTSTAGEALWKREEIKQITRAHLQLNSCNEIFQHGERIIHTSFTAELHSRRLARKRRNRVGLLSDSSTDEDEQSTRMEVLVADNMNNLGNAHVHVEASLQAEQDNTIGQQTTHNRDEEPSTSAKRGNGNNDALPANASVNLHQSACAQV